MAETAITVKIEKLDSGYVVRACASRGSGSRPDNVSEFAADATTAAADIANGRHACPDCGHEWDITYDPPGDY